MECGARGGARPGGRRRSVRSGIRERAIIGITLLRRPARQGAAPNLRRDRGGARQVPSHRQEVQPPPDRVADPGGRRHRSGGARREFSQGDRRRFPGAHLRGGAGHLSGGRLAAGDRPQGGHCAGRLHDAQRGVAGEER